MKKIFFNFIGLSLFFIVLMFGSCKKAELDQTDPNLPTPSASLTTEGGLVAFGAGLLERTNFPVPNEGNSNILTVALDNQAIIGDEQFCPYGNYGFRYAGQVYQITVPGVGVITNPIGTTQQQQLQSTNSRTSADLNSFTYEWTIDYFFIAQTNTMLTALANPGISFTGDPAIKRATFLAWAYWWKGLSYSRLGSTYLSGVIANADGSVNSNFVTHDALITEANRNFDSCIAELGTIDSTTVTGSDDYSTLMKQLVLSFDDNTDVITPPMWTREIKTYKARNLLVNKKVVDMQPADWAQVINLCDSGLIATDFYFKFGMDAADPTLDLSNGFLHPLAMLGPNVEFTFLSERLVQDFRPGDLRFGRDVEQLPYPPAADATYGESEIANIRSRGLQFGTRWVATPIESGGAWATGNNAGSIPFGTSFEENELMLAEAYINTGHIDQGLTYVDEVRAFQNAGLAPVSGTGLVLDSAKEQLRSERRIALCQRGVAGYDARRWGVLEPASGGGGRANAIVYLPLSLVGSVQDTAEACFMNYDYMDYWDVPQNELDFNTPTLGSPAVKN
jgi:starch-binding outer membrane protein, SusD/RagB family